VKTLIIIDAQNGFSEKGHRSLPCHDKILARIHWHVYRVREGGAARIQDAPSVVLVVYSSCESRT
jgi:nicotinamidase-related amidase